MYCTFFVFLKCTIQGGPKVDVLLIAFLYLWLKFWEGVDKYWIVLVRKLFYFHHWVSKISTLHSGGKQAYPDCGEYFLEAVYKYKVVLFHPRLLKQDFL